MAALALEFAILTAARSREVIGTIWAEVDLANAVWTEPPERMKAGKEHRVPLSLRAAEILETVLPLNTGNFQGAALFPSAKGGKLSGMAMTMLLRRMKVDATVHGFRSSFRDWAAESPGYADEVAEMALAHAIENKVERAHRCGDLFDKRQRLIGAGARWLPDREEARLHSSKNRVILF